MTTALLALPDRLLVFTGTVDDLRATERLRDHRLECVAVSPDEPDRVFVGTFDDGLHRSTDGGDTFERVDEGFESDAVTSLAISPHYPEEVWAGTEPSRVYRSTDGGETWEQRSGLVDLPSADEWFFPPRPHTHHVRWIEVDPFRRERLYVGIEAGAFVLSDDGGETWRERPPGSRFDNHSLATHPRAEGRVYSAAGDGYAESHDGGETWGHPEEGLDHRYCWSVAVDPADPDAVLVSSASGAGRAHTASRAESYVYRKRGGSGSRGGDGWVRLVDHGLPMGEGVVRAVLATTDEPGVVFAANDRGLYRTADFGDSWTALVDSSSEVLEALESRTPRDLAVLP